MMTIVGTALPYHLLQTMIDSFTHTDVLQLIQRCPSEMLKPLACSSSGISQTSVLGSASRTTTTPSYPCYCSKANKRKHSHRYRETLA